MEALLWCVRTLDPLLLATPIVLNLLVCFLVTQTDYFFLLGVTFWKRAWGSRESFRPAAPGERPAGLVVIPSLLRGADDLTAFTTTLQSVGNNEYPGELVVIASVDGRTEHPKLYAALESWIAKQSFPPNVRVYLTGTETRLGKMMAVEAGVTFMKDLVAKRPDEHPKFPEIYFSVDGDGTLGKHALERLAHQLCRRHPLTGNQRRVVAGKICIRPDLIWRGWRKFFTVEGQLYMQAAREFVVSNVSRYNWKLTPRIGIPGALYCTWTDLLLTAPHFMGFMHSIRAKDWLRWWAGYGPPLFSQSKAPPLPEALTGASDDTCMAFLASIAGWKDGKLDFDAPRTPLHALGRFFVSYFVERSHYYEPEARVYTYTPPTLKGLWTQRVRWNSSRVECAGRFWRAFWFHWEIGLPVSAHLMMLLQTVFEIVGYYIILPYYCMGNAHAVLGYVLGYAAQTIAYTLYTTMSLVLEKEWRSYWRVLLCLPLASLYSVCINAFGCVYGVSRDIFFFGNATKFAPEWTLMKGGCERVAISFRVRRLLALSLRAVVYGDVPLGTFWFGWTETAWTPSGFTGWTTGAKPRAILPLPSFTSLLARIRPTPSPALALVGETRVQLEASAAPEPELVPSVAPVRAFAPAPLPSRAAAPNIAPVANLAEFRARRASVPPPSRHASAPPPSRRAA